jgi:hypothetical protein
MKKLILSLFVIAMFATTFVSCRETEKKADDVEDVMDDDDVEDVMDDDVEDVMDDDASDPVENTIQEGVNEVQENTGLGGEDDA